jgi:hypothetical protein
MANDMKADQLSSISSEIDGGRGRRGPPGLNAKVRRKDRPRPRGRTTDLAAHGDAATGQVKTCGETKAIAGARQAADNDVDQRQAAAMVIRRSSPPSATPTSADRHRGPGVAAHRPQ